MKCDMAVQDYNYRVEFQLRGAAHIHGVLWIDWDEFDSLPQEDITNIKEALRLIKNEVAINENQKLSLSKFADQFISCSLKNPETVDIVKKINMHHHTVKACQKKGTKCRFSFPRFPMHKTMISVPSRVAYKDENERSEERNINGKGQIVKY